MIMIMRNRLCQLGVKEPTQQFYSVGRQLLFTFFIIRALGKQFKLFFSSIRDLGQYFPLINFTSEASDNSSFSIQLPSEPSDECSFLFSINPILQRCSFSCFFSMGLISNSHRVEAARTSSSHEWIARRLALDSSRLKSTEDQEKN